MTVHVMFADDNPLKIWRVDTVQVVMLYYVLHVLRLYHTQKNY